MKLFKLNYEYFTFLSGALISIAISLMFEIFKCNTISSIVFSILSTVVMTISSVLCFILSVSIKTLQEDYKDNIATKEAMDLSKKDAKNDAWKKTIYVNENDKKLKSISIRVILLLLFTILTCIGSMVLYYFSIGGN